MTAYSTRLLTAVDVALLKELLRVFGEAFDDRPAYQGAVPDDGYLRTLLARPDFIVIVALAGEQVVGGLAAYVLQKFERDRREVYLYDLAVLEPHRRQGVARRLILDLTRVAQEKRAYVIYVQADRGDVPAIALYESLGTREDVYHFDFPVDR